MKKIDSFIIRLFIRPLALTFFVVVFIFLMMQILKYFDDLIGKDLGFTIWMSLLGYFSILMIPVSVPLTVLLSSLITFGNLGEHYELTAIKTLGISLPRIIYPLFLVVCLITVLAFFTNNYLVPKAALEAYSLLWDARKKKPTLDLKEGSFYYGLPGVSIKIGKKMSDGTTIKDIIIYDHRNSSGNREIIIADSGKMFMVMNNSFLKMELYDGYNYRDGNTDVGIGEMPARPSEPSQKTEFIKSQMLFDLSSFFIKRTNKNWFRSNRIMRNLAELGEDMDSIHTKILDQKTVLFENQKVFFAYYDKIASEPNYIKAHINQRKDSTHLLEETYRDSRSLPSRMATPDSLLTPQVFRQADSLFALPYTTQEVNQALDRTRNIKNQLYNTNAQLKAYQDKYIRYKLQRHKIMAASLACIAMFLIGAPLGSIIKRGGMGVPVIISTFFFIIYYVVNLLGEKWARQQLISVSLGVWTGDALFLCIGIFFLWIARRDAQLFEIDSYRIIIDNIKSWWNKFIIKVR